MTAQSGASKPEGAAGFIVLGLLITAIGVAGLVWHFGGAFLLIIGPLCLLAGLGKLVTRRN